MTDKVSGADERRVDLRETYRQQMLDSIGGWTGTVITAIPPVVFVVVNAITGLRAAVITAIATGVALAVYRLVRRQPLQQALTGLFGVVIAALIAARTGEARGYFLLGIWSSFVYGGVFAASILVRRPLVGLLWEFLDPSPDNTAAQPWYRRRGLLRAYMWATLGGTVVFLARGFVQLTLFQHNATGWLAFARVSMGFPLWLLAVGFGFWVVRRARQREVGEVDEIGPAPA
ncbi:MAG TPA: DUF3159 domain-containing protein [Jatrophihabitantaceae bacterium]|nr:DUF3159 domain-containing protein [Jatrophihabitantaceae bacterium]